MFIVNGKANEDGLVYGTWTVNGNDNKDWEDSLRAAKEQQPEDWCVTDIIDILQKIGWDINDVHEVVDVYY